ncbi:alpha/beta fold hydrolase [Amycolatopsis vancoresmycina]|uniref:Putative alpha/beta hydrolase family protein n=1 Tax=Amycolatopsis vancoresmycina DSM 44592 TaxID=1292037 RepID=R1G7H7_9PSEU|nr:alpha/beta fold hydrolase [Amycolatopsis vancoresmycina]EOD67373.1 putative alpha/beta hydrolase family protein [Amycolatopsis vancoresmycina DSM 44592]
MDYVFVPGAWHGGWAWHPVARRIAGAGHRAVALTMPDMSAGDDPREVRLADAVAYLVAEVERRDLTDVVLVGHSWGGIPIAGAARRLGERLGAIAMVSAFVPRAGESMAEAMGPEVGAYVRATIEGAPNFAFELDFAAFRESLMQDEPEQVQRLVHELLVPQPGAYMLDALAEVGFAGLDVPMTYLLAERDQALALPGADLAARLGVEPVLVPGTHEAIITHADDVAKALLAQPER